MSINATLLSAFLGGSMLTVILREVINQINRKFDFDREIRKITYGRKLEMAERAVAYYWTALDKAMEIKKSLETLMKAMNEIHDVNRDIEIVEKILVQNSKVLSSLGEEKYFHINGIHLYFDLEDDNKWCEEDLGKLYDCISKLKYHESDIQTLLSQYNSHIETTSLAAHYWKEIEQLLPEYIKSSQDFVNLLEKNRQAIHATIHKIKRQLK